MLKKTAIAASVTVALAATSFPAASAIDAVGEGLLVPLFGHALDFGDITIANTVVRVTTPGTIGFDGLINNFTAPNTTPTNTNAALWPNMKSYVATTVNGNTRYVKTLHWYWFDQYSYHWLDSPFPVTPNDVHVLDAITILGPTWANDLGYLVIGDDGSLNNPEAGSRVVMFGEAMVNVVKEASPPKIPVELNDWVDIPVLALTDGPDLGLDLPTKADNIKYSGQGIWPVVSPLVTGMRTNVSNGALGATTVFNLPFEPANAVGGTYNLQTIWLDMNRFSLLDLIIGEACVTPVPGAPTAAISGWVYDSEEKRESWGSCWPFELGIDIFTTEGIDRDFNLLDLSGGGYVQHYLPEYFDAPGVTGPQTSGIAFSINEVATGDFVLRRAQEQGMYNEGCGLQDPTCANAFNPKQP